MKPSSDPAFDILKLPEAERTAALQVELEFEAGISPARWRDYPTSLKEKYVRLIRLLQMPRYDKLIVELSPEALAARVTKTPRTFSISSLDSYSPDWINEEVETPHALLIRWTQFSRKETIAQVTEWASAQWEKQNKCVIKRGDGPQPDLCELVAYRLKKTAMTNAEIVQLMSPFSQRKFDDSWVRVAVRETKKKLRTLTEAHALRAQIIEHEARKTLGGS